MSLLLSLIPLIVMLTIVPFIFASCCKLSAYLLRRRIVSWKQCFIFAFILVLISIVVNVIINLGGITMPPAMGIILAFAVQIGLGAWFFSHRATYANGQQLGWRGGAEMTTLSLIFIAAIGLILLIMVNYLKTI
jgi:hypothetical protein